MSEKIKKGRFGKYGGQFIPETLMNAVQELEKAYLFYNRNFRVMPVHAGRSLFQVRRTGSFGKWQPAR